MKRTGKEIHPAHHRLLVVHHEAKRLVQDDISRRLHTNMCLETHIQK